MSRPRIDVTIMMPISQNEMCCDQKLTCATHNHAPATNHVTSVTQSVAVRLPAAGSPASVRFSNQQRPQPLIKEHVAGSTPTTHTQTLQAIVPPVIEEDKAQHFGDGEDSDRKQPDHDIIK